MADDAFDEVRSAVLMGNADAVRARLEEDNTIDLARHDEHGLTLLHHAVRFGGLGVVEALLSHGAPVDAPAIVSDGLDDDDDAQAGDTPLHFVADGARPDAPRMIAQLIEAGADVNARDHEGRPALHRALGAMPGTAEELIAALLKAGADPNATDAEGLDPLAVARLMEDQKLVDLLTLGGATVDHLRDVELIRAAEQGDLGAVDKALEQGADPCFNRCTALFAAARRGHDAIVARLLDAGVPVDARDSPGGTEAQPGEPMARPRGGGGFTPLLSAAYAGHLSTVSLLLERGADPTLDNEGWGGTEYARTGKAEGRAREQPWDAVIKRLRQAKKDWVGRPLGLEPGPVSQAQQVTERLSELLEQELRWSEVICSGVVFAQSEPIDDDALIEAVGTRLPALHRAARALGHSVMLSGASFEEADPPLDDLTPELTQLRAGGVEALFAPTGPLAVGPADDGDDDQWPALTGDASAPYAPIDKPLRLLVCSGAPGALVCALRFWPGEGAPRPVELGMVLDHWHRRWGAEVIEVAGATLALSVARPPTARVDVERAAQEAIVVCPDLDSRNHAKTMVRGPRWSFWWD